MRISYWSSDVCSSDLILKSPLTACAVMLQSTGAICYANFVIRLILPLELQRHFQMKLSGRSTSKTLALSSPIQPGLMHTKLKRLIKIGRASCQERVCQYVAISVVAVS